MNILLSDTNNTYVLGMYDPGHSINFVLDNLKSVSCVYQIADDNYTWKKFIPNDENNDFNILVRWIYLLFSF